MVDHPDALAAEDKVGGSVAHGDSLRHPARDWIDAEDLADLSSTDQSEPGSGPEVVGADAPVCRRAVIRAVFGSILEIVPPLSSAQTAPNADRTAMGWPEAGIERLAPGCSGTRRTRCCSLHATHAKPPLSASVCVGQYGPAAAHDRNAFAPGSAGAGAATTSARTASASFIKLSIPWFNNTVNWRLPEPDTSGARDGSGTCQRRG